MTLLQEWLVNQRENDKNDFVSKGHIERVLKWCDSKGITVDVGAGYESAYYETVKKIVLDSRIRPWKRFCLIFLHECGHAMIKFRNNTEFSSGYHSNETRTKVHRVVVLIEEVEAWRSGIKLAKKLSIPIMKKDYEREMSGALSKYCSWVVSPKSFNKFT